MDSLTQIALGAAVGECIAGRKMGNRAMLWGAIAGTIPDLDIVTNLWMNDIEAMAAHRGLSHSIFFCFVGSMVGAWLLQRFDKSAWRKTKQYQQMWRILWYIGAALLLLSGLAVFLIEGSHIIMGTAVMPISMGLILFYLIRRPRVDGDRPDLNFGQWYLFFFLTFATHILIDVCTTYGTQIFQPFSDMRVTTSNISVVDPLYTLPLLVGLTVASAYHRLRPARRWANYLGIALSTAYMAFTFINKAQVEAHFEARLQGDGIEYERFMTTPTIFNNILWHGIAELDTCYVDGYYSLLDRSAPFATLQVIPKRRDIAAAHPCADHEDLQTLKWFSDGYYNFTQLEADTIGYNDWRFGSLADEDDPSTLRPIFYFEIAGDCSAREVRDVERARSDLGQLWRRILGE